MKRILRDQCLPLSYRHQMMDDWSQLKQGYQPVTNYIAQFQEYIFRCGVEEDEIVTLARFISGLREELRRKKISKQIYTLQDAPSKMLMTWCNNLKILAPIIHILIHLLSLMIGPYPHQVLPIAQSKII